MATNPLTLDDIGEYEVVEQAPKAAKASGGAPLTLDDIGDYEIVNNTPQQAASRRGLGERFTDLLTKTAVSGPMGTLAMYAYDWMDKGKQQVREQLPGLSEDEYERITDQLAAQAYKQTVQDYENKAIQDPAKGFLENATNVLGTLAGSGSPIDLIPGVGTIGSRIVQQGVLNATEEGINQTLQGERGVRDQFDLGDIALAGATGAGLQGAVEGAAKGIGKLLDRSATPEVEAPVTNAEKTEYMNRFFNEGHSADEIIAEYDRLGFGDRLDPAKVQEQVNYRDNVGPYTAFVLERKATETPTVEEVATAPEVTEPKPIEEVDFLQQSARPEAPRGKEVGKPFERPEQFGHNSQEDRDAILSVIDSSKDIHEVTTRLAAQAPEELQPIFRRVAQRMEQLRDEHGFQFEGNIVDDLGAETLGMSTFYPKERRVDVELANQLPDGRSGLNIETIGHELVHAVTTAATEVAKTSPQNTKLRKAYNGLADLHSKVKKELGDLLPEQVSNPDELLAWGMTNKNFQEHLKTVPYTKTKSMYDRFVELVKDFLGLDKKDESALSALVQSFADLTDPAIDKGFARGLDKRFGTISRQMAGDTSRTVNKAGNINLDRLNSDQDMDEILQDLAKEASVSGEWRTKSQEDTKALADMFGGTTEQLTSYNPRLEELDGYAVAVRTALADRLDKLSDLGKRWVGGDHRPEVKEAAENFYAEAIALASRVTKVANVTGRALGSFKIQAGKVRNLAAFQKLVNDEGSFDKLMSLSSEMADNPTAQGILLKNATNTRFIDYGFKLWYNFMLSGISTQFKNLVGNTAIFGADTASEVIAAALGAARKTDKVALSEVSSRLAGSWTGMQKAFKPVFDPKTGREYVPIAEAFRQGSPLDRVAKNEGQELNPLPEDALSKAGEVVLTWPTRFMASMDEFFRGLNGTSELYSQAAKLATKEGHKGRNLGLRINELVETPTPAMVKAADEASLKATLRDKPTWLTRKLIEAKTHKIGDKPWVTGARAGLRLLVPFDRSPDALFRYALRYSPLGFMDRYNLADWNAGKAGRDRVLARVGLGTSLATFTAAQVLDDRITGEGPRDPDQKKQWLLTHQPNSVKIGDEWVSYEGFEPFSTIMGVTATGFERMSEDEDPINSAVNSVMGFANAITNSFWLEQMGGFFKALDDNNKNPADAFNVWLANTAASLSVPAIARQAQQNLVDTNIYDTSGDKSLGDRLVNSIGAGYAGLGGIQAAEELSGSKIPVRRDVLGREMTRNGGLFGFLTGMRVNPLANDPAVLEIQRLAQDSPYVLVGPVDRGDLRNVITDRKITAEDVQKYQGLSGTYILDSVKEHMATPEWQEMSDDDKRSLIKKIKDAMRKFAREDLFPKEEQEEEEPLTVDDIGEFEVVG